MKLIAEGAEAKIYSTQVKGLDCVLKERIKKNYRLAIIDERLRKLRTRHEATLLAKASRVGVNVPKIIEAQHSENTLCIEEIKGIKVRDYLLEFGPKICELIGKQIGKLHSADITHGDLTTSNMIFTGDKVFVIDFGLGQVSKRLEDKAVDIHLLKECFRSKHYDIWKESWDLFKTGYLSLCADAVFEQLKKVEARGRYKKLG